MSIECGWCEHDLRGGHHPDCPRVLKPRITDLESQLSAMTAERDMWKEKYLVLQSWHPPFPDDPNC